MKNSEYVEEALSLIDTHLSSVQSRGIVCGPEVSEFVFYFRFFVSEFVYI